MLNDAMNVAICFSWLKDSLQRVQNIHQIKIKFKLEKTVIK